MPSPLAQNYSNAAHAARRVPREHQRIVKRANDGRAAARKRGVHMCRKPKLTELPSFLRRSMRDEQSTIFCSFTIRARGDTPMQKEP
jgi:hypothetical protein